MADDDNDDAGDNSDDDNDNDGTRYAGHTQSQIVRNQTLLISLVSISSIIVSITVKPTHHQYHSEHFVTWHDRNPTIINTEWRLLCDYCLVPLRQAPHQTHTHVSYLFVNRFGRKTRCTTTTIAVL